MPSAALPPALVDAGLTTRPAAATASELAFAETAAAAVVAATATAPARASMPAPPVPAAAAPPAVTTHEAIAADAAARMAPAAAAAPAPNFTRYAGVLEEDGKFVAKVKHRNELKILGWCATAEEAAQLFDNYLRVAVPDRAWKVTNFPTSPELARRAMAAVCAAAASSRVMRTAAAATSTADVTRALLAASADSATAARAAAARTLGSVSAPRTSPAMSSAMPTAGYAAAAAAAGSITPIRPVSTAVIGVPFYSAAGPAPVVPDSDSEHEDDTAYRSPIKGRVYDNVGAWLDPQSSDRRLCFKGYKMCQRESGHAGPCELHQ